MDKNLTLRLTEREVSDLDKVKSHLREKAYTKTINRLIEDHVRINNL